VIKKIILKLNRVLLVFRRKIVWKITRVKHLMYIYTFFSSINSTDYVLVKIDPNFPFISFGSDFDIFLSDISNFEQSIQKHYKNKKYYKLGTIVKTKSNIQIDLTFKDQFIYKFDLYDKNYESKIYNRNFIWDVIKSKKERTYYFIKKYSINIPDLTYGSLVRLFEYYENPHKSHHLNEINKLSKNKIRSLSKDIDLYSDLKLEEIINI